jgi:predicted extracellular nuclease
VTLSAGGRQYNPTNFKPALATQAELNARRLVLDDVSSAQNPNPIPYLSGADRTPPAAW